MPRITDIFIVETQEQAALAIRSMAAESELPALIGEAFMKLGRYVENEEMFPADSPFVRVAGQDPGALHLTIGMAVSTGVRAVSFGEIENFIIPAGKKIFCYYQGDNALMAPVYEEMGRFAEEHGYRLDQGAYEYYLNGMEVGMDKLLTRIVMPLTK